MRAQADAFEQARDPILAFLTLGDPVDDQRLADDVASGHPWIERGVRILVDHLHLLAVRHHRGRIQIGDVFAMHADPTLGRLQELQHGAAHGRLATATLAHQTERLAAFDVEGNTVDRINLTGDAGEDALIDRKMLLEAPDLE